MALVHPWRGSSAPATLTPSRVAGFGQVRFRVRGGAAPFAGCALAALSTAQQQQGLMGRTDLAGYDGMIFEWRSATTTAFYMKDTLIPLAIAWFDDRGRFVSSAEMVPCPAGTASCPLYQAASPYTVAIEAPASGLTRIGIGPGSVLAVGGSCR